MKVFLLFYFIIISNLLLLIFYIRIFNFHDIYNKNYKYTHITYFDLGSNNGDSILWLFGYRNLNNSYHVPYPIFQHFPTSEVTVHSFEANPLLCKLIDDNIDFLKKVTSNCNYFINCPIAVSNKTGFINFKTTSGTLGSSIYYNVSEEKSTIIKVKSIDIVEYINANINANDFNIIKFDIEGEEYFMIQNLINSNILKEFDLVFSEFHPYINNPVGKVKSQQIFYTFKEYMEENMIPYFEEYNISKELMKIYHYKINMLYYFRKYLFYSRNNTSFYYYKHL